MSQSAPYVPGRSVPGSILFAAHGGRINTYANGYGISGAKMSFKGRRPFLFGAVAPLAIRFVWGNWYAQAVTGSTEVIGTAAIAHRAACMAFSTGFVNVTIGGAAPNIPAAGGLVLSDWIWPRDCGLASFPPNGRFEFRGVYDLAAGQTACPINSATNRPGGGQSMRYAVANEGALDVLANSTVVMSYPSGYDSIPVHMPIAVIGIMPSGAQAVLSILSDSITYNQGDYQGVGDIGGGYFERACYLAGIPSFNGGVSGLAGVHYSGGAAQRKLLLPYATGAIVHIGTNDYFSTNQASYSPLGVASVQSAVQSFAADFKAASGGGSVGILTIPPRTTAGNNSKWTTIADQTPDSGFVTFGLRDQHNALVLSSPASFGCDWGLDTGSLCADATTKTAWRVSAYSATLTAACAASATSATVTAAPNIDDIVVYDAGNASVDTNASIGVFAAAITGSANPYTLTHQVVDAYSNSTITYLPASAHASGAAVKVAFTPDGIHPSPNNHKLMARALAPYLAGVPRR